MVFVNRTRGRGGLTLAHLSDLHLCHPRGAPLSAFLGKRTLSLVSWLLRRRRDHGPEILERLVATLAAAESDHRLVTGDLVQLALPSEFRKATGMLERLGGPEEVFVVPGNHDALVRTAWRERARLMGGYVAGDGARAAAGPEAFPAVRFRGPVALIGVSSARPTPPLSAAGSLGEEQARRLEGLLAETGRQGFFRIVLIHHPPFTRGLSPHKRLRDLPRLLALIRRRGAELVLHGHTHRISRRAIPGPRGPVPVLGISSASCASRDPERRSAFRMLHFELQRGASRLRVQDFRWEPACRDFRGLPEYTLP